MAHGAGHAHGILGAGDRGGRHHGVAAELHRQGGVGGRADASVEHHGHLHGVAQQGEVVGVADAHAAADGGAERHHRGAADVLQAPREHGVVGGVGEHDEALVDELLGGAQQLGGVGQQGVLVADHLELDPIGGERLAGEAGGEHGVAGGVAAGGVGQQLHAGSGEHVDQGAARGRIDAPQRDGHELQPLARIAAAINSSEGNPPVPSSRRERRLRPAIVSGSVSAWVGAVEDATDRSSSLHRAEHLHAGVRGEREGLPGGAGNDLAIDRDRDAARVGGQPEPRERSDHGLSGPQVAAAPV